MYLVGKTIAETNDAGESVVIGSPMVRVFSTQEEALKHAERVLVWEYHNMTSHNDTDAENLEYAIRNVLKVCGNRVYFNNIAVSVTELIEGKDFLI